MSNVIQFSINGDTNAEKVTERVKQSVSTLEKNMQGIESKFKNFGKDLTFYGGGVDTQHVLPHGTPQEVRDEVKRRIDDLAPGGGFIFNTVHNIQADVPPENIMAMWEALAEYGVYRP